jgi:hypothetical protein
MSVQYNSIERVEQYLILASLRCPECGELGVTETPSGEVYKPADFEIESIEDWENQMTEEWHWMKKNREEVRAVSLLLSDTWPKACASLRHELRQAE